MQVCSLQLPQNWIFYPLGELTLKDGDDDDDDDT